MIKIVDLDLEKEFQVKKSRKEILLRAFPIYFSCKLCNSIFCLVHVEVYGCQMNVNDTEIVHSILKNHNYTQTSSPDEADILLLMTCAIREGAEHKIWHRLAELKAHRKQKKERNETSYPSTVGIIGNDL